MSYITSSAELRRKNFLNSKFKQFKEIGELELSELTKTYPWQPFVDIFKKLSRPTRTQ